jgi:uncharacterized protein
MSGVIRPRATLSPCIGTCRMDTETNLCVGCGRTLSEIADWGSMTDAQRAIVRHKLPARLEQLSSVDASAAPKPYVR